MKNFLFTLLIFSPLAVLLFIYGCSDKTGADKTGAETTKTDIVARGKYLVIQGGCTDCHSPKVMTPNGPVPDTTRLFSGHPAEITLPKIEPAVLKSQQWIMTTNDLTAWVGPWGMSFTANLTPDEPTGTGTWTEEIFIKALRTGKHMGFGRQILPPMPWTDIGKSTDEDLKAIFAYFKSLPPIRNQVPDPIPPDQLVKK